MEAKERIFRNENENRILKLFMVFEKKNWKIKIRPLSTIFFYLKRLA